MVQYLFTKFFGLLISLHDRHDKYANRNFVNVIFDCIKCFTLFALAITFYGLLPALPFNTLAITKSDLPIFQSGAAGLAAYALVVSVRVFYMILPIISAYIVLLLIDKVIKLLIFFGNDDDFTPLAQSSSKIHSQDKSEKVRYSGKVYLLNGCLLQ